MGIFVFILRNTKCYYLKFVLLFYDWKVLYSKIL